MNWRMDELPISGPVSQTLCLYTFIIYIIITISLQTQRSYLNYVEGNKIETAYINPAHNYADDHMVMYMQI